MRLLPLIGLAACAAQPLDEHCKHVDLECDTRSLEERYGDEPPDASVACGRFVVIFAEPNLSGEDYYYRQRDGELVAVHHWTDIEGHDTWYGRKINCEPRWLSPGTF